MPEQPFGFSLTPGITGFWTDMRFPVLTLKVGANEKPDFDYTRLGRLMPQNDPSEKLLISDQFPHELRLLSTIGPHVHFIQESAVLPTFKLDYRIYDIGAGVPAFTTVATTGIGVVEWIGEPMHQVLLFPPVQLTHTGLSAWFDAFIYRDDNDVTGDVL